MTRAGAGSVGGRGHENIGSVTCFLFSKQQVVWDGTSDTRQAATAELDAHRDGSDVDVDVQVRLWVAQGAVGATGHLCCQETLCWRYSSRGPEVDVALQLYKPVRLGSGARCARHMLEELLNAVTQ